jgi:hypothetical protein
MLVVTKVTFYERNNLLIYYLLIQENDMVFKCLEKNDYQHEKCAAYFENYRFCKHFWVCISVFISW